MINDEVPRKAGEVIYGLALWQCKHRLMGGVLTHNEQLQ